MDMGFSFIHASDLHLDSPFRGFSQLGFADEQTVENVLRQLRDCTFTALDNIVKACLEYKVDFLVLAGDIYDLADRSLRAQLRFREALQRLAGAGISVFVTYGNHDHDEGGRASLTWPDNVHFFAAGEVEAQSVVRRGKEMARVYGISYPRRDVSENYALRFKRESDAPFAVAALHCNVGGHSEHANYAPCSLDELVQAEFDYWALGHVHSRSLLRKQAPWVVYPGSTQGRHLRETGAKGCYLVRVTSGGVADLRFLETDCVRWEQVQVLIDGLVTEQELLDRLDDQLIKLRNLHEGRSLVVRLKLTGRGSLHKQLLHTDTLDGMVEELRYRFAGPAGQFIWPESIQRSTTALMDKKALRESETLLGDLLSISQEARSGGHVQDKLVQTLAVFHDRAARYLSMPEGEDFNALLETAEEMALDLLWEEENL